jgi:hypothetical protein
VGTSGTHGAARATVDSEERTRIQTRVLRVWSVSPTGATCGR